MRIPNMKVHWVEMANNWRHWKSGDPDQTEHFLTPLHHSYPPPQHLAREQHVLRSQLVEPQRSPQSFSDHRCLGRMISKKNAQSAIFQKSLFSTFFLQCCELVHVTYMTSPHESRWDPVLPVVEENHCTPQGTKKVWSSKKYLKSLPFKFKSNKSMDFFVSQLRAFASSLFVFKNHKEQLHISCII